MAPRVPGVSCSESCASVRPVALPSTSTPGKAWPITIMPSSRIPHLSCHPGRQKRWLQGETRTWGARALLDALAEPSPLPGRITGLCKQGLGVEGQGRAGCPGGTSPPPTRSRAGGSVVSTGPRSALLEPSPVGPCWPPGFLPEEPRLLPSLQRVGKGSLRAVKTACVQTAQGKALCNPQVSWVQRGFTL